MCYYLIPAVRYAKKFVNAGRFHPNAFWRTSLPIIQVHRLVKKYKDLAAVAGVDFSVEAGECFGLIGPNGAGKTTTVRMITATSLITEGEVEVDGKKLPGQAREVKAIIGLAPQVDNLDPDLTVLQNLLTFARYFDIPRREALQQATENLEFTGLTEKQSARIQTLSGGMRRRLLIARALINRPHLLILDEPTIGLDPQTRHLVWQKLRALKDRGVTQLVTTQNMEEATRLCDRLAIMDRGQIVARGSPTELIAQYGGKLILEARPRPEDRETVVRELDKRGLYWQELEDTLYVFQPDGAELEDSFKQKLGLVSQRSPNLEDVFLRLTGRTLRD